MTTFNVYQKSFNQKLEIYLRPDAFFLLISASAAAQNGGATRILKLGETPIKIKVYQKKGALVTFVALHRNEQTSINVAKKLIEEKGGRLIELESLDEAGKPSRRLKFEVEKTFYSIDPNRIFTDNGRACDNLPAVVPAITSFADQLLKLMLSADGKTFRKGEKFLVALHNNQDIDDAARNEDRSARENDLTAFAYVKGGNLQHPLLGRYAAQAAGVFLSNTEPDEDNFLFLSSPTFLNFFTAKGFHVVVQKSAANLKTTDCAIDDGSLSIYFGQQNLSYINLEADRDVGAERQRQMIEAVYELIKK